MNYEDLLYKTKGIDPSVKKAYVALFNSSTNKETSKKVIEDLIMRFKFYGAKPTNDTTQIIKNTAYREVIEYILTMSSRISEDTLVAIENFINK